MSEPESSSAKGSTNQTEQRQIDNNNNNDVTANPLFGASPPSDASSSRSQPQPQPPALEQASISEIPSEDARRLTDEPLYGASPPQAASGPSTSIRDTLNASKPSPTPRQYVLQHGDGGGRGNGPYHNASNSAPRALTFVRRLSFILSVVLGVSASIAGIWSYFILPLLHSSFSARKALLDQQVPRYNKLLDGLRRLRSNKLYGPPRVEQSPMDEGKDKKKDLTGHKGQENEGPRPQMRREASLKEITSSASISSSSSAAHPHHNSDEAIEHPAPREPVVPLSSLRTLSTNLNNLTSALDNTSTTRTSLISTLESYTSHLHHQMFVSRAPGSMGSSHAYGGGGSGFGGYSIGGTLGMNLKQASGGAGVESGGGDAGAAGGNGEDWDSVRKEIRAIKGLLLNRRAFAHAQPQSAK
ncbi:hypothetical protein IAU59_007450 [Kwoniella sp. CBS 9459]